MNMLSPVENSPAPAEMGVMNGVWLSILMSEFDPSDPTEPGKAKLRLALIEGLVLACLMYPGITPSANPR